MDAATSEAHTFLRVFFNPDNNGISLAAVDKSQPLQRLVSPLLGQAPQSTVLPWRKPGSDSKKVDYWFGIAQSARAFYELQANLQAFVGSTFACIQGGRRSQSKDTPFARAIQDFTDGYVIAFTGESRAVFDGVLMWLDVHEARPDRHIPETRSTGLLLRDFDAALQTQDRAGAEEIIGFLRADHRLDFRNLQFLEIQWRATFREWSLLLNHEAVTHISQIRRPSAVTDALLRAIYHFHLKDDVRYERLPSIAETLHTIAGKYGNLWSYRTGLSSREAWLTYGFAAGLQSEDYNGVQAALEALESQGGSSRLLVQLRDQLKLPGKQEDPWVAFGQRDYDQAFQIAMAMPSGLERARLLLMLSRQLDELEVLQEARTATLTLSEVEQEQLGLLEQDALAALQKALTPVEAQISGWLELLQALNKGAISHAQTLKLARSGHTLWTLASLIDDVSLLEECLLSIPNAMQQTFQDILTYVIDVLMQDEAFPNPALRESYDLLLILLLDTPYPRPDAFYNAVDLLPGILGSVDVKQYRERIHEVLKLLDNINARLLPDRLLDFLDLLTASACPDESARQACFTHIEEHRKQHDKHWSRTHWHILLDLEQEVGLHGLVPPLPTVDEPKAAEDPLAVLKGKYVGIYTLTESAGQRMAYILNQRVPDVRIKLNHAKASTEQLRAMAQNADVMIVVTSSATHAATQSIMDNLGSHTTLVRPEGKGSSSMLSALEEEVS